MAQDNSFDRLQAAWAILQACHSDDDSNESAIEHLMPAWPTSVAYTCLPEDGSNTKHNVVFMLFRPDIFSSDSVQRTLAVVRRQRLEWLQQHKLLATLPLGDGTKGNTFNRALLISPNAPEARYNGFEHYSLFVRLDDAVDEDRVLVDFKTGMGTKAQAQGIARQLDYVLRQLATVDPSTSIESLDTIPPEDLQHIWSMNQNVPSTIWSTVSSLLVKSFEQHADSPAVCAWDGGLSYRELDILSSRLSQYLVQCGVRPGVTVPVCFERSLWAPVAMVAVIKAGGVGLAIDVTQPEERLRANINQILPAPVTLSSTSCEELALKIAPETTNFSVCRETVESLPDASNSLDFSGSSPADAICIVFTSGSTGKPKGIKLTHSNFSSALFHQSKHLLIHQSSRVYYFASFAFDAAWHNLLHTLYNGACLCVPSESERKNDVSGSICRYRATWADLTPRLGELLEDRALDNLQLLQLAGERPNPAILKRLRAHVPVRFAYGPAECAVMSTISTDYADFNSIGSGYGLCTWVVHPDGSRLMPVGSVGELWLEGPLVGEGYLRDSEKTAKAFIQDPPWLLRGTREISGRRGRLYRTGDLVRYDGKRDGSLTFVGRKDGQIKLRGQRVELDEVDHHLWQHLQAAKAAVYKDGDHSSIANNLRATAAVVSFLGVNRPLLVAFVCPTDITPSSLNKVAVADPKDDIAATVRKLTQGIDERLSTTMPSHMVPSAFIPVTCIPLTPTGKSDRRRLQGLASTMTMIEVTALGNSQQDHVEPSTPNEKTLQKLWSEVMGISAEKISAEDSFYRIGGDSIIAMKLVGLARQEGISLTVAMILRHHRLCDLARILVRDAESDLINDFPAFALLGGTMNKQLACSKAAAACGVDASSVQDMLPCTPLQEGLLALTSSRGDYVTRHVFRVLPGTNLHHFRAAWTMVVSSAPILRTRIIDIPGQGLMQVVLNSEPEWNTMESSPTGNAATQDISMGLGTCLSFFSTYPKEGRIYFTWTAHHAIFDAWSIGMIFKAVSRAYHKLPVLTTYPFARFVGAIRASKEEESTKYWRAQFAGSAAASFPTLPSENYHPRADTTVTESMGSFSWLTGQHTIATAAKASWAIVQASLTEGEEVLFGSTLTGRQFPVTGIECILGPTIATVPLRILVDQTKTVRELFTTIQEQGIDMIAHEQAGLPRIRRVAAEAGASCDFQTMLVIQPKQMALHSDRGIFHDQIEGDILDDDQALNSVNSYALMVQFELDSTSARARFSFDSHVMTKSRVQHVAQQLKHTFRQICDESNHSKTVQDLELVPPEDVDRLWKQNALVPPTAKVTTGCVHDMITAIAQQQPTAPAVAAWNGDLSYQELDALSTRLARHLVKLGVKPEAIIPICFEKSVWTPVAQLAVMKAGGACLTLDVDQPKERLRALIEQVHPTILLTSLKCGPLAKHLSGAPCFKVGGTELKSLAKNSSVVLPSISQSCLAYVVFTSGSTGTPKGAMVTHANAVSATSLQTVQLKFKPTSRVLDFTSYAFDVTWSNFIHTLVVGGCLCVPSDHDRLNSLTASVQTLRANYVHIVPSVSHLIDYAELEQLEVLHFSGEPLPAAVVNAVPPHIQIINSYGPAECTVTSTMKDIGTARCQEITIGKPLGILAWVVRSDGRDVVSPGAAGELWLEGPLVGRGYYNDPEKTSASFVEDPIWLSRGSKTFPGRKGRLYRTGDIVRQENDGDIAFVGRKDGQVKINGQRVELGEVEYNVRQHLPKSDSTTENVRLTAEVITLSGSKRPTLVVFICPWVAGTVRRDEEATRAAVQRLVNGLTEHLAEHVPVYMIPTAYVALAAVPTTATGKTDRRQMRQIATAMEPRDFVRSVSGTNDVGKPPSNPVEHALRDLWESVLGCAAKSVSITDSFIRLGGDSITAMQLVSRARNHPLRISIKTADILRLQTIQKIAEVSRLDHQPGQGNIAPKDDSSTESWPLTPIQRHFFRINPNGDNHWNQSVAFRLKRDSHIPQLHAAIQAVAQRHHSLRARFRRTENGTWEQSVAKDNKILFQRHTVESTADMVHLTKSQHGKFDIVAGPVFAADVFTINDRGVTVLVLSAHHLVVDLVSWRIIWDDLEQSLRVQSALRPTISFRQWCNLQERELWANKNDLNYPFLLREADLDYWGIVPGDNVSDNFEICTLSLGRAATAQLLGGSNSAYRTEPVDIIIAVLIKTFQEAFYERRPPPIWVEGHGREPLASYEVDLSETVGWFTSLHPVQLPDSTATASSLTTILRETKDMRRQTQLQSRQYFANRQIQQQQLRPNDHGLVEVLLNYIGRYDRVQSGDSLFASLDGEATVDIEQISPRSKRLALIELIVGIRNDELEIRLAFNTRSKQQNRLRRWVDRYLVELGNAAEQLCKAESRATWADFPLLKRTSYKDLDTFIDVIASTGVAINQVREIYPCTPMQEGILLSRTRGTASYANNWVWTCHFLPASEACSQEAVSVEALRQAWESVIARHPIFATVFVEEPKTAKMTQLVLDNLTCRIHHTTTGTLSAAEALRKLSGPVFSNGVPEYQVTICQGSSNSGFPDVACRLDMSHAMTDAESTSIIIRDLQKAYRQQLQPDGPRFSGVLRAIQSTTDLERERYWIKALRGAEPCLILGDIKQARHKDTNPGAHDVFVATVPRAAEIFQSSRAKNITPSTFLQVVWALVLYSCTGIEAPCFGFLSSGRDLQVDDVEEIVGPLINMLVSRVSLHGGLDETFSSTSSALTDHLDHQHMSLAKVQHELGLHGKRLFNTSITIRNTSSQVQPSATGLSLDLYHSEDLHEFDVTLAAEISEPMMGLFLTCRRDSVSRVLGRELQTVFETAVNFMLDYDIGNNLADSSLLDQSIGKLFFTKRSGNVCEEEARSYWTAMLHKPSGVSHPTNPALGGSREELTAHFIAPDAESKHHTLETIVRVTWALLQAQYTDEDDVIFGNAVAGNSTPLAVTPARVVIDRTKAIGSMLDSVQKQIVEGRRFESTGLHWIRRLRDDLRLACEFQTLLTTVSDITPDAWDDLSQSYAFVVQVDESDRPSPNEFRIRASFCPSVLDKRRVHDIARQFSHVFNQLCRASAIGTSRSVGELDLISPEDLASIWDRNTKVPPAVKGCVHELFAETARRLPEAPAICAWDGQLVYRELHEVSSRLAHHLVTLGVRTGVIVPICCEKSLWTPVIKLAVMKAGAACLALDTNQPEERLRSIVQQVRPIMILSSTSCAELAGRLCPGDSSLPVVVIGGALVDTLPHEAPAPLPTINPSALLYVVFTSGSTGTPKAVMISHQNFCSAVRNQQKELGFFQGARVFDFVSYAFDVSWSNFLHSMTVGACLCIPSDDDRMHNTLDAMDKYHVTYANVTPSMERRLELWKATGLKVLVLSGETLDNFNPGVYAENVIIKNTYGPSECTVKATIETITKADRQNGSIGKPIGCNAWVVHSETHNLVPPHSVGELWLEGPQVGGGYLFDASKTASAFVDDPPWLLRGSNNVNLGGRKGRLYRTGDLVRQQSNGNLIFIGRKDGQVKIRGQRVELGEVEYHVHQELFDDLTTNAALRTATLTAEVVILSNSHQPSLVVFIHLASVSTADADAISSEVRCLTQTLNKRLGKVIPGYMIPSAYIAISSIPMTATGKLDRRQLKTIAAGIDIRDIVNHENGSMVMEPSSIEERLIRDVWATALNMDPSSVPVTESFTRLGGDSITAMQIVARCRELQMPIRTADILRLQSIREIAHVVKQTTSSSSYEEDSQIGNLSLRQWYEHTCKLRSSSSRPLDMKYWGVDLACEATTSHGGRWVSRRLSTTTTAQLVGSSNLAFRTEWYDIVLAVLHCTFKAVFPDRDAPTIFLESSRDCNEASSGTSLSTAIVTPIELPDSLPDDIEPMVRYAKDTRCDIQRSGHVFDCTSYRQVSEHDHPRKLDGDGLVEILFNSDGHGGKDEKWTKQEHKALFEVVAGFQNKQCVISFRISDHVKQHQDQVEQWLNLFVSSVERTSAKLSHMSPGLTLSDLPLLQISYQGLDELTDLVRPTVALANIQNIYPCTPLQEGILLSRKSGAASYANHWTWTCQTRLKGEVVPFSISTHILQRAWEMVIARQSVFGTIFIDSPETGEILQLVRTDVQPQIVHLRSGSESSSEALQKRRVPSYQHGQPEYMIHICEDSAGEVACRLDMNHALSDASSIPILMRDLKKAYNAFRTNQPLPLSLAPLFSEAIRAINEIPASERQSYWEQFLAKAQPCCIPTDFARSKNTKTRAHHIILISAAQTDQVLDFCRHRNITQSTFLHVVWALVLNACTGSQEPCFGFLSSGRDLALDRVGEIVGPLINILASRVSLHGKDSLDQVLTSTSNDLIEHLNHQHMSLAGIHHHLGLHGGQQLFNTSITIRNASFRVGESADGLDLREHHNEDPHEFDMTLAVEIDGTALESVLTCRRDTISTATAIEMKALFEAGLSFLLDSNASASHDATKDAGERFFKSRMHADWGTVSSYWSRKFAGLKAQPFPATEKANDRCTVKATVSEVIDQSSWKQGTHDISVLFQAAWALVQADYTGENDVVCGITVSPKFAAVMPLRITVDRTETVQALLLRLKQQTVDARPFKQTGIHCIRRINAETSLACQFRTLLIDRKHRLDQSDQFVLDDYALVVHLPTNDMQAATLNLSYDSQVMSEEEVRGLCRGVIHTLQWLCEPTNEMVPVRALGALPLNRRVAVQNTGCRVPIPGETSASQLIDSRSPTLDRCEPSTQREKQLQLLWATILGIDPIDIGANDSFFYAGGDSIFAMRLVGAARKQGLRITVSDILRYPRLKDLAQITSNVANSSHPGQQDLQAFSLLDQNSIDQEAARVHVANVCDVSKDSIQDIMPCTPLQQGLLAMTANRDGDYVGRHVFKLLPHVDRERFKVAWQSVVANTPILRTRIVDLPGQGLVQAIIDCQTLFHSETVNSSLGPGLRMGLGTPLSYFTLTQDPKHHCSHFIWTIHHALYDAWSMSLIFDAVVQAYSSEDTLKVQHEPFSTFVKATVVDSDKDEATAFWAAQFEDLAAVPFPDNGPQMSRVSADSVIVEPIKGDLLWKDDQYTITTAIRAAWAICQSIYTDNQDVVFGTTITGRQAAVPGIDQIIGPTIAAVPVRLMIQGASTVRSLLRHVHDQGVQMIPHEQSGLAQIRQINQDTERACQFQTLLVVQPEGIPGREKSLFVQERSEERVHAFTSYPLMVQVELQGSTAQLRISFDSKIVSEAMVQSIAWQFSHTLRQVCNAPHQTAISDLDSIPREDLDTMWMRNANVPVSIGSSVHGLLDIKMQRQPTASAICAWDGNLSYSELDTLSTRLAHSIIRSGLGGPDTIVPLCFEKSMWTPVAMLAVMKAGSASVVLDVSQPEDRLRTIFELVSTSIVLCSASCTKLAARLVSTSALILAIDHETVSQLPEHLPDPLPTVSPTQRICVIFTSGSTGTPKGIEMEHRHFSSALVHQQEKLGLSSTSRYFSFASHSFDATWHNLLHTLWSGACLCIPSETERRNELSASIVKYNATFADFTPTVAQTLNAEALATLQSMILVGETGEMRIVNRIRQSTEARFVYGPAECSVMTTISDSDAICTNIGHQFGLRTWVVRRDGKQLVPSRAVGELWIEGPLVGRGYLADREKTRASFVEDPSWLLRGSDNVPGRHGRLYRTGDLVRREEDGSLTFIGRKDSQVKLRGQRVELGEVEHHVLRHLQLVPADGERGAIAVAAEVVKLSNSKRPTLVVFVCPTGLDTALETGAEAMSSARAEVRKLTAGINERLAESLPTYMVPSAYIPLLQLPMTATGKTDRRRLREMALKMSLDDLADLSSAAGKQERSPPSTNMEIQLQELWATVLSIERGGIHAEDTFFRLGGDSISAMRLVEAARIKGLFLTVSDIMKHPRLSDLARVLRSGTADDVVTSKPFSLVTQREQQAVVSRREGCFGNTPFTTVDTYPASFVQRYYIEDSSETRLGVHFLLVDIAQGVDVSRLEAACQRTVEHFDILRTVFSVPCGRTLQVVLQSLQAPFERMENVHDLDRATQQICQEHQMETLYDQIILRFFAVQDLEGQTRMIVRISHAQYDAITLPAVLSALGRFYDGQDAEEMPSFATVIPVFTAPTASSLSYWSSVLQGSVMSFPAVLPSAGLTITNPGITITRTISAQTLRKLRDITPAHYFTAACAVVLARLTGSKDVLFGRLVSGRAGLPSGLTNASGPCINTVPVRAIFQKDINIAAVLAQVVQQYVEGIPHEQVGFDDLRDKCVSWTPSVQNFGVVTKYQNVSETPPLEMGGFKATSRFLEGNVQQTKFNMVRISGYPEGDALRLVVAANAIHCSQESLAAILHVLVDAMSGGLS